VAEWGEITLFIVTEWGEITLFPQFFTGR